VIEVTAVPYNIPVVVRLVVSHIFALLSLEGEHGVEKDAVRGKRHSRSVSSELRGLGSQFVHLLEANIEFRFSG